MKHSFRETSTLSELLTETPTNLDKINFNNIQNLLVPILDIWM
jgi:hypothetical protein